MNVIGIWAMPVAVGSILLFGLFRGVNVFQVFVEGAKKGIETSFKILPSLIGLMVSIAMLKASGALDVICHALLPIASAMGIPQEIMPLALLRPVSGGGSIALLQNILADCGPDSFAGRVASVIAGASDTTFYAVSLYFGSIGVKNTRQTIPAALIADLSGVILSGIIVTMLFAS